MYCYRKFNNKDRATNLVSERGSVIYESVIGNMHHCKYNYCLGNSIPGATFFAYQTCNASPQGNQIDMYFILQGKMDNDILIKCEIN